ncbi:MAG: 3-dehydroquinate synthase, partial [Prevotella sp.]|nr:3-dehydroquinate synthase [Prevotella sp.]
MEQRIIISQNLQQELAQAIAECEHDKLFVLVDETTREACWPLISNYRCLKDARLFTIGATDTHKDLNTISHVWTELQQQGATRHSCLINLGGGMVTDLGGFAASTFKRGIDFINIPTTLLSMVDASVGGKTGINFGGLKNEIGVFNDSRFVILDTRFLQTLDQTNLRSGYAEMLKHALISNEAMWAELINYNLQSPDLKQLQRMVADSVKVKERIVSADPHEHGLRKALNLGHTIGHAFESFALAQPNLSPLSSLLS